MSVIEQAAAEWQESHSSFNFSSRGEQRDPAEKHQDAGRGPAHRVGAEGRRGLGNVRQVRKDKSFYCRVRWTITNSQLSFLFVMKTSNQIWLYYINLLLSTCHNGLLKVFCTSVKSGNIKCISLLPDRYCWAALCSALSVTWRSPTRPFRMFT